MREQGVYQQLRSHLAYLRLGAAAEQLAPTLEQADKEQLSHTRFLERLLDAFAVDGMASGTPVVYQSARSHHVAAATRDIVIDAHEEDPYIAYMIRQAGRLARRTGVAIAVGHAYPATYEALRRTLTSQYRFVHVLYQNALSRSLRPTR